MKKLEREIERQVINVEFVDPLRSLLLRQCKVEDRAMASMVRVICKRYFAEQMLSEEVYPQPQGKDKLGGLAYYPDELPESKLGEGGQNPSDQ